MQVGLLGARPDRVGGPLLPELAQRDARAGVLIQQLAGLVLGGERLLAAWVGGGPPSTAAVVSILPVLGWRILPRQLPEGSWSGIGLSPCLRVGVRQPPIRSVVSTASRHYFAWYALNVLEVDEKWIALQLGHRDGGGLVRTTYGPPGCGGRPQAHPRGVRQGTARAGGARRAEGRVSVTPRVTTA
jgi:hypothetical protein